MEGVFNMQSSTFGRLCITQRIDLRGTYTCPKKEVHYTVQNLADCTYDLLHITALATHNQTIVEPDADLTNLHRLIALHR